MGLRVLVGRLGSNQPPGLEIDVMLPLGRAIATIGPMQPCVEPLWRVGCRQLGTKRVAHLIVVSLCIGLAVEITTLPAPIAPSARQAVKHLLGAYLANVTLVLRQFPNRIQVSSGTPQPRRHLVLFYFF